MSKQKKQRVIQLTVDALSLPQTLEFYELVVHGYRIFQQKDNGQGLTTLLLAEEFSNV